MSNASKQLRVVVVRARDIEAEDKESNPGCQIYGFLGGLTGTTSIMTLAAIAVDRYCVIVFPLNPYKRTTHARAILIIVFTWFYSAIFSTMPLLGINHYVSEGFLTSCSFDYLRDDTGSRIFIFVFFLAAWVCPLSCIVFSYFAIFRMVVQAEKLDFFNGDKTRESFKYKRIQDKLRKDVKIALLTTFIILVWVLAWTPYAIVALLGIFGQKQLITPVVSAIPGVFCKLSSSVNPFIYSINHPRLQKELRTKCQNLCKCHNRAALRKCSPRSVSFGISVSDNYEFQTRKFDYGSEMNTTPDEGVSLKLAVQAEQNTPHSRNEFNKEGKEYSYSEIGIISSMKKTNKINSIGVSVVCQQRRDQVREPNGRYSLFKRTLPCPLNKESQNISCSLKQNLSCSPKRRLSEPNLILPIVATQETLTNLSRCKSFH